MQIFTPPPRPALARDILPRINQGAGVIASVPYHELCSAAGIRPRVSGANLVRTIVVTNWGEGLRLVDAPDKLVVALPGFKKGDQHSAMTVLEMLAYGFQDYAAREALCGRGFFVPPRKAGRPASGGRSLTGTERSRRSRAKAVV